MRLFQVREAGGATRLGVLRDGQALVLQSAHDGVATTLDLLEAQRGAGARRRGGGSTRPSARAAWRPSTWDDLAAGRGPRLGLRSTRRRCGARASPTVGAPTSARRAPASTTVCTPRSGPELFFKATASRCVAHGEPIGRRRDSAFTAAEPEIAIVLGRSGAILGFTLANDVSAWDIERDNPLYLPQSKVYTGCFAFGPTIVTPDEIADPYAIVLRCRVLRGEREVFAGEATTGQLKRRFEELVGWLARSNEIRTGTVLSTGTGIIQPLGSGLEEGDVVVLSSPELGELRNPVALV